MHNLVLAKQRWMTCECLWNISSENYRKRDVRQAAVQNIIATLHLTVTEKELLKKLNHYRSNWTKERRKVENSKRSGSSTDAVYVPKLWYYPHLLFLAEQVTPRTSSDSLSQPLPSVPVTSNFDEFTNMFEVSTFIILKHIKVH
jgi:hypothetical protein